MIDQRVEENPWAALMAPDPEIEEMERLMRREDKLANCLKLREYLNPETKILVRGKWPCGLIECPTCLAHRAERLGESLEKVFEITSVLSYVEVPDGEAASLVKRLRKMKKRYVRFPIDGMVALLFEPPDTVLMHNARAHNTPAALDLQYIARTPTGRRISTSFGIKMFPSQRKNDRPDDGDDIVKISVPHLRYDGSVSETLRDDTWAEVLEATKELNPRTAEALERDLLAVTALYQDWIRQALTQEFEAKGIPPKRAAAKAHLAVMMERRRKNVNITRLDWHRVNELRDQKDTSSTVNQAAKASTWWRDMQKEDRDIII